MFTIVMSSTTISWASPTTPRISHLRGSGPAVWSGAPPVLALTSLMTLIQSGGSISA